MALAAQVLNRYMSYLVEVLVSNGNFFKGRDQLTQNPFETLLYRCSDNEQMDDDFNMGASEIHFPIQQHQSSGGNPVKSRKLLKIGDGEYVGLPES